MITFQERLLKGALQATAIFSLVMLFYGAVLGENPGCTNSTCKDINIERDCRYDKDYVYKYITCYYCKLSGRCNTGGVNSRTCNANSQAQKYKSITTTMICDCGASGSPDYAERTGTYTDDNWNDSVNNQALCSTTS